MGQDEQAKLIPSDRVEEIVQAIKDMTSAPYFKLVVNEGRTPGLTDTKLGGLPYWPVGQPYPETKKGIKLMLLAQLDLADFGGDERLPGCGLLQFFIDSDDDCSGLDFDDGTNQNGFRVVWHETVDPSVTPEDVRALGVPTSFDSWDDCIGNPLRGEFALDVEAGTQWMTPADERFDAAFMAAARKVLGEEACEGLDGWYGSLADEDGDMVFDLTNIEGPLHQVFGYPLFTQYDPRYDGRTAEFDTLLLQVDSDGAPAHPRCMWGDVGIGNFFINGEALSRGDFSNVLYNWDCY